MTESVAGTLKKTPLHASHVALGARMVPFGGWDMPVEYSGITAEHMAVRTAAGLFDVSHMGEFEIAGKGALEAVQHITSNDASKLRRGRFSIRTDHARRHLRRLLVTDGPIPLPVVINAGNNRHGRCRDSRRAPRKCRPTSRSVNSSDRYALIAVQGRRHRTSCRR